MKINDSYLVPHLVIAQQYAKSAKINAKPRNNHSSAVSKNYAPVYLHHTHLQDILELPLLFAGQTCWKFDVVLDHKVATLTGLLRNRHAEVWIAVCAAWLCWPTLLDGQVLTIDGGNGTFPTCKSFLKVEINGHLYVVVVARKERVLFLFGY